jgi:hypothetical protein
VRDRAVGAVPRTDVAKDHERGRAVLPTLTDVRAVRLLADCVQVERPHQLLQVEVISSTRRFDLEPRGFPLRKRLYPMATHDLVERLAHPSSQWRRNGRGGRNLRRPE